LDKHQNKSNIFKTIIDNRNRSDKFLIMKKVGRNTPCHCGSGKKYKRCCEQKEAAINEQTLPPGKFQYKAGSYGGANKGYMPSIICYKDEGNSLKEHFCLVKPDKVFDDEDTASSMADKHLSTAKAIVDKGGSPHDFALSLRHEGYKSLSDFNVIS